MSKTAARTDAPIDVVRARRRELSVMRHEQEFELSRARFAVLRKWEQK